MRNNPHFIKAVLNKRNEFRVNAEFTLFGYRSIVDNLKIDTGCGFTTFPLKRLGIYTDSDILSFKEKDIDNGVKYMVSYGVETGGQAHKVPVTKQEKMDCRALGFQKDVYDLSIGGLLIGHREIRINYDRQGNLLLGMDIMKDWDIHIGSAMNGETIFLGCPKDRLSKEYYVEIQRTFGYMR